jgi:CRP/FNR family cyclic AMP-dependent transcriptional regulator
MQQDDCGREAVLEELREHEFFNELRWLEGCTTGERYQAGTSCTILHVPRALLDDWLRRNPQAAQQVMQALARRLAQARRRIGSLALNSVYARVVNVLLERGHDEHGEWQVDAGAEFIASLVGASREMVSRVVADLIRRGLVRRIKRQIAVPNRSSLETYAKNARTSMRVASKAPNPAIPLSAPTVQRLAA